MQLSNEWLDFLKSLKEKGPADLQTFHRRFKDGERAKRLLGEIIRQGLIDLDEGLTRIIITRKGLELVQKGEICR